MKRLADSELELMQIIWDAGHPVTRLEIEYQLPVDRKLSATTILSFLSRCRIRVLWTCTGKERAMSMRRRCPKRLIYRRKAAVSGKWLYQNSVGNFMTALGSGDELSDEDLGAESCRISWIGERRERGK